MSSWTEDEICVIAERSPQTEDSLSSALFDFLVEVAVVYVKALQDEDRPSLDDPNSFRPNTLGNASYIDVAIEGLRENLVMRNEIA